MFFCALELRILIAVQEQNLLFKSIEHILNTFTNIPSPVLLRPYSGDTRRRSVEVRDCQV